MKRGILAIAIVVGIFLFWKPFHPLQANQLSASEACSPWEWRAITSYPRQPAGDFIVKDNLTGDVSEYTMVFDGGVFSGWHVVKRNTKGVIIADNNCNRDCTLVVNNRTGEITEYVMLFKDNVVSGWRALTKNKGGIVILDNDFDLQGRLVRSNPLRTESNR
jgi:hypothetical protein